MFFLLYTFPAEVLQVLALFLVQFVWHILSPSSFSYSTSLPRMVDAAGADAEVENGVVKVTIPKLEEEKPKRIEVKKKA